jgi:diamine N-acetyltransferase
MFLKSNSIFLRALESTDLELIYALENNMEIWQVSNTLTPFNKDVIELYLHAAHQDIYTNKQLRLMICLNDLNTAIGTIDLFDYDPMHLRVGIGILIFDEFRKRGYAFEAIELIKQYCKNTLLLNQLYCNISESNAESISLFEKSGFEKIGLKKQWNRIKMNQFEDELMFQCIL